MAAEANERVQRSVPGTVTVAFGELGAHVALRGEWDISTQPQLTAALQPSRERQNVVIDLSECSFLDSTTIGMLITLDRELAANGGRLAVVLPPSQNVVNRAFSLLRVREVLSVHDTLEASQLSLLEARAATPRAWLTPSRPMPVD